MVLENAQNNIKREAQNESADNIKLIDVKPGIVEMDVLEKQLEEPNNTMDAAPNIEAQEASPKGRRKRSLDKTSSDVSVDLDNKAKNTVDVTPKRAKRNGMALANISQHKSSVAVLNELRQNLVYKLISQAGPVHMPTFTMSVEVDGQVYEGTGRNKKMAKADAADNALRQFIQFRDGKTAAAAAVPNNLDFTSDDFSPLPNATDDSPVAPVEVGPVNMRLADSMREKGPVMLLNELYNDAQFALVSENGTQFAKFKMTVLINKQLYEGTGPSKKMAKAAAAKSALSALCNISYGQGRLNAGPLGAAPSGDQRGESLPQAVVDHIGKLVIEKFNSLMENDPVHARRKVLAGIVMTRGTNMEDSEVISVATGTKCVSGAYISARGRALNDSHAEIVARRCLIDYLYKQMELHVDPVNASKSILVRDPHTAKFKVQDTVKFHLYINTAPCGDARIFSPHEEHTAGVDKHPNRTARGQLRTKIESGEGTIPVKNSNGIQTWDGVIQGDRLLTMSCSDKLCRWNVVGVQGALLATVLEPLYLHSIVLGSLLHPVHMYRAICGRVEEHIQGLPPPYRLNKPLVSLLSSSEIRNPTKAPSFSVNWTTGMQEPEIVNSLNGTDLLGGSSRISKISLFKRYRTLIPKLMGYNFKMADVYSDNKASATEYKTAKDMVHNAFRKAGLGEWLCKPCEQDQFELEGEQ